MKPDQITRLQSLRDQLVERSLADADPANWVAGTKAPKDMTRDERGDAKWCRGLAINTVSLALQVQRLLDNPAPSGAGNAPAEDPVQAEVARFEAAAAEVLAARAVRTARNGTPKR